MSDIYQVIVERDNLAPNYRSKLKAAIPNKKQLSFTTYKPGWIFGRIRALKMLWSPRLFDCLTFQFLPFFFFCLFVCLFFFALITLASFVNCLLEHVLRHILEGLVISQCLFIRHLHISHYAPYFPPKFCITFAFHFFWVLQPSQEKLKTMLMQNFGGQIRFIMGDVQVAYMRWDGPCLVSS